MDEYQNQFGYRNPVLGERYVGLRNIVSETINPPGDVDKDNIDSYLRMKSELIIKKYKQISTPKVYGKLRQGYLTMQVIPFARERDTYVDHFTYELVEFFESLRVTMDAVRNHLRDLTKFEQIMAERGKSQGDEVREHTDKVAREIVQLFHLTDE